MLRVFRIHGDSMQPTLHSGDYVIAVPWLRRAKSDCMYMIEHPHYGVIVKRAVSVKDDGSCLFASENNAGLTSLQIGLIEPQKILGRVLLMIRQGQ